MLVAGNLNPSAPYLVMLMDDKGQLMAGAIPSMQIRQENRHSQIGWRLQRQPCWSTLKIEDKTPPVMICNDTVEVSCYKADTYPGPLTRTIVEELSRSLFWIHWTNNCIAIQDTICLLIRHIRPLTNMAISLPCANKPLRLNALRSTTSYSPRRHRNGQCLEL